MTTHRRTTIIAVLIALGLTASLAVPGAAAAEPPEAPAFTLADAEGGEVSLPARRDGVDIYYFWATWCPFCSEVKPELDAIQRDHEGKVRVFAINFRETENDPAAYLAATGYDFTLLLDGESIAEDYGAWVLPGVFVVDGDGRIRFNLYDNPMPNPPGYGALDSAERAKIRAPWWGARIREAVEAAL
ncbi:MAG: TlpA family protein disulfide reductase [Gammaproteobacteria bacterium]|nr:TlpA family protein disulfide reductase [Gammaproteobacteria bacterium]TVQ45080.1 MAG: TlpA family protein disulfide reductase [Gammaproteobacteria bacterium]